ncbi:MAG: YqgE/AlgH family protein [Burkholderiaceae bacterium]|nr:YqgE/AlgH family protein [Burkholderiaceae bacterium]
MSSNLASDLSNHFLIAMPNMADPNFGGTVVFVAEHGPDGALGLVVNRPMDFDVERLFERIELPLQSRAHAGDPVYYGGPVQTDRGFVLHQPIGHWGSTVVVGEAGGDGLGLTSSKDILEAVGIGEGPQRLLVALGYSGWGPGQLEDEVSRNAWLTTPASASLMFDTPVDQRVGRAFALLGVDPAFLTGSAGHA